jgi:peptidoglycan/LPS O-acetylase OafA/YrhL
LGAILTSGATRARETTAGGDAGPTGTATAGGDAATAGPGLVGPPEGGVTDPVEPPTAFAPERIGYMPALDGLRGAGLICVMAFHAGFPLASGGPLSVSMFFTLSGFLIASLSLSEVARTGRLSLARFWERRARRLLPAALVALGAIVALQWFAEVGSGSGFRTDLLSTLAYATNWRLIANGDDYANLFAAPSPLTHFWSLAIEEQFYVLFPLAFAGVMALCRRRPLRGGLLFGGAAVASFALAAWSAGRYGNSGLTYYGTHTRAGEVLLGVVLAYALAHRGVRARLRTPAAAAVVRWGAVPALGLMFALWSLMTLASPSLFRGVTLLNGVLTAWVILAATMAGGPINTLLGNWPLRTLGKVSYAAYLVHWPIFILLDGDVVDWDARPLFALRVAVTVAVAAVSYWVVEYPFRKRLTGLTRPRLGVAMAVGAAAVAVAVLAVPVHVDENRFELDLTAERPFDGGQYRFDVRDSDVIVPNEGEASIGDILLVGDSVSWSLLPGVALWNDENPGRNITLDTHMAFGCPLGGPGDWLGPGGVTPTWPDCRTWLPHMEQAIERTQPDAVVILMGLGDIGGRHVEGEWRSFGDPVYDEWFAERLDRVADALAAAEAPVVWVTYPDVRIPDPEDPTASPDDNPINDPERMDTLNQMIRRTVDEHPGFRVADLNGWMRTWPDQFDPDVRDGVHFTLGGSQWGAGFVVPEAIAAMRGEPSPPAPPTP